MKRLALIIGALVTVACGGGGGVSGGGGGGGTEIPIATRSAAIKKVEDKAQDLYRTATTTATRNTQLATYMKSLPEFSDAKVSADESVWGRFTDGRYMVVVNNRLPDWYTGRPAAKPVAPRQAAAVGWVSKSTKARLFHSFGTGFSQQQDPINDMSGWLRKAGYTISPTQEGDARLATLRDNVKGDGFLYFNTHGGSFTFDNGDKVFCIGSSTLKNDDNERLPEIKGDLDAKRVVYMTAANGERWNLLGFEGPKFDTRYAITSKFVDSYWSFGDNAILFINACWSSHTAVANGAQTFIAACHKAGAGAYLGWTNKVATPVSENAPKFFVDRLTAANEYDKESPDQRPFFASEIVADMKRQGVVPGSGVADLICTLKGADVGLRPTISYVQMLEPLDELHLHGEFGNDQGEVRVDGVAAAIVNWSNDLIRCTLPKSGQGSFGDVIVKAHNKESNKRQLTKWTSNFNFTQTSNGTLRCTVTAKLVMRQDLAKTRAKPGDTTKWVSPIPFFVSPESTCSFAASGEHRDGNNKLIEKWTGGGSLPIDYTATPGAGPRWIGNGAFDPVTGEFAFGVVCGGPKRITGSIAPGGSDVVAGAGSFIKIMDKTTFVVPAHNEPGTDLVFSYSQWNPVSPPNADTQYRAVR